MGRPYKPLALPACIAVGAALLAVRSQRWKLAWILPAGLVLGALVWAVFQIMSDGLFTRDYIFVDDVVDGYLTLAGRCQDPGVRGEAFNFSPGIRVTVLAITALIRRLMDREDLEPIVANQARAEIRDQYLDAAKAADRQHRHDEEQQGDAQQELVLNTPARKQRDLLVARGPPAGRTSPTDRGGV